MTVINCFSIDREYSEMVVQHAHDCHEIYYSAEGNGTQHTGFGAVRMQPGDLYLFPVGQEHMSNGEERVKCTGYVINFETRELVGMEANGGEAVKMLLQWEKFARKGENLIRLSEEGASSIRSIFEQAIAENQQAKPGFRAIIRNRLEEMLIAVLRDTKCPRYLKSQPRNSRAHERIANVTAFLKAHFTERVSVNAMARMACMSSSHFHAIFKRETGSTLVDHVNALRVEAAREMLATTDFTILDIALRCGFASLGRFYEVFGKFTGETPGASRKCLIVPGAEQ
jgi:AraC-like DNA-binding protein